MTVKVGELLETLDGRLALELVAGVTGLDRPIEVPRVQEHIEVVVEAEVEDL